VCGRYVSVVDIGVAVVVGAVAGVQPPPGTPHETCRAIALTSVAIALGYAATMAVLRPLRDPLESGLHLTAAGLQVAASVAGLAAVWPEGGSSAALAAIDSIALVSFAVFFAGAVALAAKTLLLRPTATATGEDASLSETATAPLLATVPLPTASREIRDGAGAPSTSAGVSSPITCSDASELLPSTPSPSAPPGTTTPPRDVNPLAHSARRP
jgi:hypothetical protein